MNNPRVEALLEWGVRWERVRGDRLGLLALYQRELLFLRNEQRERAACRLIAGQLTKETKACQAR